MLCIILSLVKDIIVEATAFADNWLKDEVLVLEAPVLMFCLIALGQCGTSSYFIIGNILCVYDDTHEADALRSPSQM